MQAPPTTHLDWPLKLRFLVAQPHHSDDRHGNAEPVEEAEEVDNWEDVIGKGIEERHQALRENKNTHTHTNNSNYSTVSNYLSA